MVNAVSMVILYHPVKNAMENTKMSELCVSYGCLELAEFASEYCVDCGIVGDEE